MSQHWMFTFRFFNFRNTPDIFNDIPMWIVTWPGKNFSLPSETHHQPFTCNIKPHSYMKFEYLWISIGTLRLSSNKIAFLFSVHSGLTCQKLKGSNTRYTFHSISSGLEYASQLKSYICYHIIFHLYKECL